MIYHKWFLVLLIITLIVSFSCSKSPRITSPVQPTNTATTTSTTYPPKTNYVVGSTDEAIVQVWESDNLAATGVVVGDGSHVLTILDYEDSVPSSLNLSVVAPGRGTYKASVQAIDSRTAVSLLKLKGSKLPVATTGDALTIKMGQQSLIKEWYGSGVFRKTQVQTGTIQDTHPLSFNVQFSSEIWESGNVPMIGQGAVVTDEKGVVLGLVGMEYGKLFPPIPYPPGLIPYVVTINSALELLSPDATQRPWANGPLLFAIAYKNGGGSIRWGQLPTYDTIAMAITEMLNKLKEPLAGSDLQQNWSEIALPGTSKDSVVLTVIYAWPVDLRNTDGNLLARAKWIGIQWNRDQGKPNRLCYGNSDLTTEGGFVLHRDMTDLAKALGNWIPQP